MTLFARILLSSVLALSVAMPTAQAALPEAVDGQSLPSLAPILDQVTPAVVNVATRGTVPAEQNPMFQDPFFRRFFGDQLQPQERAVQSLGSGVIVDAENGYIITNAHVIQAADEIKVAMASGREFPATLVGSDPETDVAVIQIDAEGAKLSAVPFGDSSKLRVGDFVIAVGNPFSLGQTATSGIVSALERTGLGIEGYESFIQTDASINPGNSGGALVNLKGELVGINTAILAPSGGNIGIGFAIPINMARSIAEQLIEHGQVERGQLGVGVQDLTPQLAQAFELELKQGAVITQVLPGSTAAEAGLAVGDAIVGVNGQPVVSASGLRNRVGLMRIGESVELTIVHEGERKTVKMQLQKPSGPGSSPSAGSQGLAGASLAMVEVSENGGRQQRIGVVEVEPGSPAAASGLRPGDIIVSVNRQPVSSIAELQQAISSSETAVLLIRRGEGALFLPLQ